MGLILTLILVAMWYRSRYELLDSRLGAEAWHPTKLLEVIRWDYHPENHNPFGLGYPNFFDFQHQALLRLLDIQGSAFGRVVPPRCATGVLIDHSSAIVEKWSDSDVVIVGTATLYPCLFESPNGRDTDGYWQMERFVFARTGQLLSRNAYEEDSAMSGESDDPKR